MREIKFRIWDKQAKIMRQWDFYWNVFCADIFDSDYLIPMQYTGLKDKNGKEIYEGDIVLNPNKIVVEFGDADDGCYECGGFCHGWVGREMEGTNKGLAFPFASGINAEIIGNIYENPDLLTNK